jgi:hypothetical protein
MSSLSCSSPPVALLSLPNEAAHASPSPQLLDNFTISFSHVTSGAQCAFAPRASREHQHNVSPSAGLFRPSSLVRLRAAHHSPPSVYNERRLRVNSLSACVWAALASHDDEQAANARRTSRDRSSTRHLSPSATSPSFVDGERGPGAASVATGFRAPLPSLISSASS